VSISLYHLRQQCAAVPATNIMNLHQIDCSPTKFHTHERKQQTQRIGAQVQANKGIVRKYKYIKNIQDNTEIKENRSHERIYLAPADENSVRMVQQGVYNVCGKATYLSQTWCPQKWRAWRVHQAGWGERMFGSHEMRSLISWSMQRALPYRKHIR